MSDRKTPGLASASHMEASIIGSSLHDKHSGLWSSA